LEAFSTPLVFSLGKVGVNVESAGLAFSLVDWLRLIGGTWTERAYPKLVYFTGTRRAATSPHGNSRKYSRRKRHPSGHKFGKFTDTNVVFERIHSSLLKLAERAIREATL